MALSVKRFDARPWSDAELDAMFAGAFPDFITADAVASSYIGRVREWFAGFAVMVLDGDDPVACGWGAPVRWDGSAMDLPTGYTDTLRRAVELHEAAAEPDTFVICGGIVSHRVTRRGVAKDLIGALRELAVPAGLARVIAPVRPTLKPSYPLIPIETYAQWRRADGLPFDPWVRTHIRCGARIVAVAPQSQIMTGTVAQWETWTGLQLPSSGDYVIPRGLSPLHVDRENDLGTYTEPNVWVQHR